MKRRFFLAGILAAPVVAAVAPVAAKAVAAAPVRKVGMMPELGMGYSGGFTAAEIKLISDSAVTYYLKDKRFFRYNPTLQPRARRSVVSLRQRSAA